jgi:hypothetical protein
VSAKVDGGGGITEAAGGPAALGREVQQAHGAEPQLAIRAIADLTADRHDSHGRVDPQFPNDLDAVCLRR